MASLPRFVRNDNAKRTLSFITVRAIGRRRWEAITIPCSLMLRAGRVVRFGGPPPAEAFDGTISLAAKSIRSAARAPGGNRDRPLPIVKIVLQSQSLRRLPFSANLEIIQGNRESPPSGWYLGERPPIGPQDST